MTSVKVAEKDTESATGVVDVVLGVQKLKLNDTNDKTYECNSESGRHDSSASIAGQRNPDRSYKLLDLPNELLVAILDACDVNAIIRCMRVCRRFRKLIESTAELQLHIEANLSGQETVDSLTSPADLLHQLRAYNNAWKELSYTEEMTLPKLNGGLWELYGGVFAMTNLSQSITFHRLPSPLKGIKYDTWTLGDFGVRFSDFGMDPSQDLLVLVEAPSVLVNLEHSYQVHLRTLSTGKPHPLASAPILSFLQAATTLVDPYNIQVSGSHIGVLVHARREDRLYIWEWKTGKIELILTGKSMDSFLFFSDSHILLATYEPAELDGILIDSIALCVVDFINEPSDEHKVLDLEHGCLLSLPPFYGETTLLHRANLRADPAPEWAPGAGYRAPFYPLKQQRTYVLSFDVLSDSGHRLSFVLLFPRSTVQSCVENSMAVGTTVFSWEKWGVTGSRFLGPTITANPVWICYVNGSRYVHLEESANHCVTVKVFDLNPFFMGPLSANHDSDEPTVSSSGAIFDGDVITTYPYHVRTTTIPDLEWNEDMTAICSEDCILIIDRACYKIRVFAF